MEKFGFGNYPLDHVGIAVPDLAAAIDQHTKLFGFVVDCQEEVPSQGVALAFLRLQNTLLELLTPTTENSSLAKFLATRGPGLHHICYRVTDIVAELARLEKSGVVLIDKAPRPGAHGSKIAFLHPKSTGGVLIELCQRQ